MISGGNNEPVRSIWITRALPLRHVNTWYPTIATGGPCAGRPCRPGWVSSGALSNTMCIDLSCHTLPAYLLRTSSAYYSPAAFCRMDMPLLASAGSHIQAVCCSDPSSYGPSCFISIIQPACDLHGVAATLTPAVLSVARSQLRRWNHWVPNITLAYYHRLCAPNKIMYTTACETIARVPMGPYREPTPHDTKRHRCKFQKGPAAVYSSRPW